MKYDVIVAGAGPSGCMAALAAARMGAKVLLIEKGAYPGGMNTSAMVCPLMTFHSGSKQIVKGIARGDRPAGGKRRYAGPYSRPTGRHLYHNPH